MYKKLILIIPIFLIFSFMGYAHVGGYEVDTVPGTEPTIDGIFSVGEWDDATEFIIPNNGGTAFIKHHVNEWDETVLYIGIYVNDVTYGQSDLAKVSIDGWHDNGNPMGVPVAPKEDDMRCLMYRDNFTMFEEMGFGGGWTWGSAYCWAAASNDVYPGHWEVEFAITYDEYWRYSNSTNGLMIWLDDAGSMLPVINHTWPPDASTVDLATWGNLNWPGAPGYINGGMGHNNPGNHDWYNDPSSTDVHNEMLQFYLFPSGEDIKLYSVTLTPSGTGNDATDITKILFVYDANQNGNFDPGEQVLAEHTYAMDDTQRVLDFGFFEMLEGNNYYFLVVYQMAANAPIGATYSVSVSNIWGEGEDSMQQILSALGVSSGTKTIIASPTSWGYGDHHPPNHNWYYNETADQFNEMFHGYITASNAGNVELHSVTIQAQGTGDDAVDIDNVNFVLDANKNGIHDGTDMVLASGQYTVDNGQLVLIPLVPHTIPAGQTDEFLVSYTLNEHSAVGSTYYFNVMGVFAVDHTDTLIDFGSLPAPSSIKTTVEAPSGGNGGSGNCTGEISFVLTPEQANAAGTIYASLNGLSNCGDKMIFVTPYSCSGVSVCNTFASNTGAQCSFSASLFAGNYLYYACVDVNGDGDFADLGEIAYDILSVSAIAENCAVDNCGGCTTESECTTASCNWCGTVCKIGECGPEGENGDDGEDQGFDIMILVFIIAVIGLLGLLSGLIYWKSKKKKKPR